MNRAQNKILASTLFLIAIVLVINIFIYFDDFWFHEFVVTGILPSIVILLISLGLITLKRNEDFDRVYYNKIAIKKEDINDDDNENFSGRGLLAIIPYEIEAGGWNWGGLLLGWLWALGNKLPWSITIISIFFPFIMNIVLGLKGNKWAWQYKRWLNVEHFFYVQRKWKVWGFIYWGIIASVIIYGICSS